MIILSYFLILSLYKVLAAYVLIGLNMNFRAEYLLIGQNIDLHKMQDICMDNLYNVVIMEKKFLSTLTY